MNKSELISAIAEDIAQKKPLVEQVLASLERVIKKNAHIGEPTTVGLITITVEHKGARTGRNPQTGEAVDVPAKNVIKVKVAKALKDAANS